MPVIVAAAGSTAAAGSLQVAAVPTAVAADFQVELSEAVTLAVAASAAATLAAVTPDTDLFRVLTIKPARLLAGFSFVLLDHSLKNADIGARWILRCVQDDKLCLYHY